MFSHSKFLNLNLIYLDFFIFSSQPGKFGFIYRNNHKVSDRLDLEEDEAVIVLLSHSSFTKFSLYVILTHLFTFQKLSKK